MLNSDEALKGLKAEGKMDHENGLSFVVEFDVFYRDFVVVESCVKIQGKSYPIHSFV